MKNISSLILIFFLILNFGANNNLGAQGLNCVFQGQLDYSQDVSDVWGYAAPNGKEYALVGVDDGLSIVDVSNSASPG